MYKASSEIPEELGEVFQDVNHRADEIYSQSAYTMEELDPNFILTADSKLLDAAYEKSMEELEARIEKGIRKMTNKIIMDTNVAAKAATR